MKGCTNMKKTYNGRRVYDRDDLYKAADIMRQALKPAGKGRGYYSEKDINAAVNMMMDIADGMGEDDGIICDGFAAIIEHGI